jgi:hypothetical protein
MPAMGLSNSDEVLHTTYQKLHEPGCEDREARLQVFCEAFWDRIIQCPPPSEHSIDSFVTMLQCPGNLLLARLVISDLRPSAITPTHPIRRYVVQQIQQHNTQINLYAETSRTQNFEDTRLYGEELKVLQETDLYRACILLYGRGNMTASQKDEVRKWLERYPGLDC